MNSAERKLPRVSWLPRGRAYICAEAVRSGKMCVRVRRARSVNGVRRAKRALRVDSGT